MSEKLFKLFGCNDLTSVSTEWLSLNAITALSQPAFKPSEDVTLVVREILRRDGVSLHVDDFNTEDGKRKLISEISGIAIKHRLKNIAPEFKNMDTAAKERVHEAVLANVNTSFRLSLKHSGTKDPGGGCNG